MIAAMIAASAFDPAKQGLRLIQLSPGGVPSSFSSVNLDGARVERHDFGYGVQLRRRIRNGRVAIGLLGRHAARVTEFGTDWREDEVTILSGRDLDLSTLGPGVFSWIETNVAAIEPFLEPTRLSGGHTMVRSPAVRELRRTCCQLFDAPSVSSTANVERAIEGVLKTAEIPPADAGARERYRVVRRAEAFLWDNISEPVMLKDIARTTFCSTRRLLYAFHSVYGLGPATYFKILRLNSVRNVLTAGAGGKTILDIAAEFGFWHQGHFGSDYRRLFGETPSQTRRRAALQLAA
jgi:AraC-like DNA-binding protein